MAKRQREVVPPILVAKAAEALRGMGKEPVSRERVATTALNAIWPDILKREKAILDREQVLKRELLEVVAEMEVLRSS